MKILLDWWKSNRIVVGCPANLRKLGSAPCQQTIQKPHNEQLLLYWAEEISSEGGQDLKGKLVVTQIHPIFYVHLSKLLLSLWNHAFTSCAFSQQCHTCSTASLNLWATHFFFAFPNILSWHDGNADMPFGLQARASITCALSSCQPSMLALPAAQSRGSQGPECGQCWAQLRLPGQR